MNPTCVRCERPTPDGYACVPCAVDRPRRQLAEILDLLQAARDVAYGLNRSQRGGTASGTPGSRVPLNLPAAAKLDGLGNALGSWVRHISAERGVYPTKVPPGFDVTRSAATYLADHCEWLRHRPEVDEFLTDIEASARAIRGITNGPVERVYLGPCGADLSLFTVETGVGNGGTCDGDVYGPRGGRIGTCRTCGAHVDQDERQAWLDKQVADQAFRAAHIAEAYRINVNTIRSWALDRPEVRANNGNLIRRARPAKLREHGRDLLGKPLYLVGDVLDLARKAAKKRAESEARRAALGSAGQGVQ